MRLFLFCFIAIFITQFFLTAKEYLIPIGHFRDKNLLICNLSSPENGNEQVSLYSWNAITKEMTTLLSTFFQPLFVHVLPDGQTFSFIDQGRLQIKQLYKRSPQTILLDDQQIIESAMYCWIDDQRYIVCAWRYCPSLDERGCLAFKKGTYGLYRVDRDGAGTHTTSNYGMVSSLVTSSNSDALWPIIFENSLFYVRYNCNSNEFSIICINIDDPDYQEIIFEAFLGEKFYGMLALSQDSIIYFLYENNIHHAILGTKEASSQQNTWHSKELFQFHDQATPLSSVSLFSPILAKNKIIYFDEDNLKAYELEKNISFVIVNNDDKNVSLCVPYYVEGTLYCGFFFEEKSTRMWVENHTYYCDFPTFMLPD